MESLQISMTRTQKKDKMEWEMNELIAAFETEVSVRESHVHLVLSARNESSESEVGTRPRTPGKGTANTLFTNGRRSARSAGIKNT